MSEMQGLEPALAPATVTSVAVAVPPAWEPRRPRRRRWLMASAAVVMTATLAAPPARSQVVDGALLALILGYLQTYVVPVLEMIVPLPDTMDGAVIQETLGEVGTAATSYLGGASPESILARLFPEVLAIRSMDEASAWAAMRHTDRQARVAEAMSVTQAVIDDVAAASLRADAYRLRNELPFESVAGVGKLGNVINLEVSGTLKQLAEVTAESAQLEADERAREDWQRQQGDLWEREHYGDAGFWAGERSWVPETMGVGLGGR